MTRRLLLNVRTIALIALLAVATFATPQISSAAQGDCGQPVSNGPNPVASDALNALSAAVGLVSCDLSICDVNCNGTITAPDALSILNVAVSLPVEGFCECGPTTTGPTLDTTTTTSTTTTSTTTTTTMNGELGLPCTSAEFFAKAGSDLDTGWKGTGHNAEIIEGASITFAVVKRCSAGAMEECQIDEDCAAGTCKATCNCNPGSTDTECEVTGPTSRSQCVSDTSVECTANTDCGGSGGNLCVTFFGPPLPLAASGVPVCVTTYFQEPLTGTADSATGQGVAAAFLRSRVHLGINLDTPCPRCGDFAPGGGGLEVGDMTTCDGGPKNGVACTVEAISPTFGGVSSDCPPDTSASVAGQGLNIRFRETSTQTVSRTANLVCASPFDGFHPSSGTAACLNDFSACDTNSDCPGSICGVYCHCGFCADDVAGTNLDPNEPCFDDLDCDGRVCTSNPANINESQENANACQSLVCGEVNAEECCTDGEEGCASPTGLVGECNEIPAACSNNQQCVTGGNGDTCILEPTACFESTITRTGTPSPLGSYCTDDPAVGACTSNADCAVGACTPDSAEPTTAALFCVPATASSAINGAAGTPGPGAIEFRSAIITCRCGDGVVGCDEACDDGNNTSDDGCDQACRIELP